MAFLKWKKICVAEALVAPMNRKEFYKKKTADHFRAYQAAVEVGNTKAMKYHEQEYLT